MRDMVIERTIAGWGDLRLPGCPIVIDGPGARIEPAPALDADRDAVLDRDA